MEEATADAKTLIGLNEWVSASKTALVALYVPATVSDNLDGIRQLYCAL